jgi:hypothetical protein
MASERALSSPQGFTVFATRVDEARSSQARNGAGGRYPDRRETSRPSGSSRTTVG